MKNNKVYFPVDAIARHEDFDVWYEDGDVFLSLKGAWSGERDRVAIFGRMGGEMGSIKPDAKALTYYLKLERWEYVFHTLHLFEHYYVNGMKWQIDGSLSNPPFDFVDEEDGRKEVHVQVVDFKNREACYEIRVRDVAKLRKRVKERLLTRADEVKDALRAILTEKLEVGDAALDLSTTPSIVLFIGVNGVGKTTSIGKLAAQLKAEGKKVLLCAGDTFRAAAADQLEIWANRAGVDIIRQNEGADPGSVLFDALQAAKARHVDVVLCDTAGRLHNKQNLMNELAKLRKIIDRECPDSVCETLLVLDATTGQNGLIQARTFKETAGLTGIVLTKLDGTAKGGIVIAIAQELQVPVKFVGVGEGIDDLKPFNAREFTADLF